MDAAARERLVEQHLDLARKAAATIFPRVKGHVEFEELVALANEGLAEAAQRFEPDRGAQFETFAWYRVHGAILDGLRSTTNLPRRAWRTLIALRAADAYLENRGEREVGAARRGASRPQGKQALAQIRDSLAAVRTMYVISLEAMREAGFDRPDAAPAADSRIDSDRFAQRLRAALEALPEKERALVTKHYWEGKNLLEAGAELGISKSWASRLHAQAVERLRHVVDDP